jgi:hypothetical protein
MPKTNFKTWLISNRLVNSPVWKGIYALSSLTLLAFLFYNHYQIASTPYPIDYFESAMPAITKTIMQGNNPYQFSQLPEFTNPYPPLYNLIAAPLTSVFSNDLPLHRSLAGIFIIASCLICFLVTLRAGSSKTHSLAAATTLYACLLFFSTPLASTNSTGLFFFLLTTFIPWRYNFSKGSLIVSVLCGVLAFYGKQYFILGLAFVSLYLFIAVSKKTAIIYGISSGFVVAFSLVIVIATSPYYLDLTVFLLKSGSALTFHPIKTMINQMKFFGEIYVSLIIAVCLIFQANRIIQPATTKNDNAVTSRDIINIKDFDAPLLTQKPNFFLLCFIGSTLAVVLALGWNGGNYMSYLFQLMSPFLLIFVFVTISKSKAPLLIVLPFLLFFSYKTYSILNKDFSIDEKPWKQVEALIESHESILGSPILTAMLMKHDKKLYHNSLTFFFHLANEKPEIFIRDDKELRTTTIWKNYLSRLSQKIENKEFDLLLLSSGDARGMFYTNPDEIPGIEYLEKYYRQGEVLKVSLTKKRGGGKHKIIVWTPKESD